MSRRGIARHNPKRDELEAPIVEALEAQGFCVTRINGRGVPDLVVGKGPFMRFIEIKAPKGTYTPAQVKWRQRWTGPAPLTLRSVEDALRFQLLAMEDQRVQTYGRQVLEREQRLTGEGERP